MQFHEIANTILQICSAICLITASFTLATTRDNSDYALATYVRAGVVVLIAGLLYAWTK